MDMAIAKRASASERAEEEARARKAYAAAAQEWRKVAQHPNGGNRDKEIATDEKMAGEAH
jgi:hypothetical protein